MHLKSLEVFGFKSFPFKTHLKFDPGITVIVGPNGCGKSNVFDAIKWALGEQSPKSLRGNKMEDVIFNGTDKHPPLNYAEVTLVFCNEDRYLPIEFKEISITRRLYRSGESQYFLNKSQCRLKDIQELFLGTGIGESSYSFIEQGKVEMLLNYKPEEKRLIFDEASGIVKYKERKKETLRRLKDTEENITRLDDVISEVNRQIRYLERQVAKARRYQQVKEDLIAKEKLLAAIKITDLSNKADSLLEQLQSWENKEKEYLSQLETLRNDLIAVQQKTEDIHRQIEQVHGQVVAGHSKIESAKKQEQIAWQRIEELKIRKQVLFAEEEQLAERKKRNLNQIEEEKNKIANLDNQIINYQETLEKLLQEKIDCENKVNENNQKIKEKQSTLLHLEKSKVDLHNQIVETETQLRNIFSRKKRLVVDREHLKTIIEEYKNNEQQIKEKFLDLEEAFKKQSQYYAERTQNLQNLISRRQECEKKIIEQEKVIVELSSYLEFLKDLGIKYDKFPVSTKVNIIFKEKPPVINKLIASLRGVEFESVDSPNGVEYKAEIEAKIISLPEEELEKRLKDIEEQRRQFLEEYQKLQELQSLAEKEVENENNSLAELKEELAQKKNQLEQVLADLSRCKQEDEVLAEDILAQEKEIEYLQAQKEELTQKIACLEQEYSNIKQQIENIKEEETAAINRIKDIEVEYAKKEAELKALGDYKDSFFSKLAILEEERNNIEKRQIFVKEEIEQADIKILELEKENENLQNIIKEQEIDIKEKEGVRAKLEQEKQKIISSQQEYQNKINSWEKELEEIRANIHAEKMKLQQLEFEKAKIKDYLGQVYSLEFNLEEIQIPEGIEENLISEEIEKLKKRLKSLGEVNLIAIEEFEELNKRYQFLNQQKEDLIVSQESLRKAIQKINRTCREVFTQTFEKIQEEFKRHFRLLFGGGRAQLVLLEPDNVLESGVEIEVQPPGKKLQSVLLLSGGEKALTAIALIFAIFKIRPSPLCVLDEIDAPLDEVNVDRFNTLLKEFAPTSQFIIITHNKKTMSYADVLYGVTMQEKGISKLVSVKFSDQNKENLSESISSSSGAGNPS